MSQEVDFSRLSIARLETFPLHRGHLIRSATFPSSPPSESPGRLHCFSSLFRHNRRRQLQTIAETFTGLRSLTCTLYDPISGQAIFSALSSSLASTLTSLCVKAVDQEATSLPDIIAELIARLPLLLQLDIYTLRGQSISLEQAIAQLEHLQLLSLQMSDLGDDFAKLRVNQWSAPLTRIAIESCPNLPFTVAWKIAVGASATLESLFHLTDTHLPRLNEPPVPSADDQPVHFPRLLALKLHRGPSIDRLPLFDAPELRTLFLRLSDSPDSTFTEGLSRVEGQLKRYEVLQYVAVHVPRSRKAVWNVGEADADWERLRRKWPKVELKLSLEH